MTKKFIPNGDMDFVTMAEIFAQGVANDPAKYFVSCDDSAALSVAVERFRAALNAVRAGGGRSQITTAAKDAARIEAEKIIRRIAGAIRNNPSITAAAKMGLDMRERSAKQKELTVPNESPRLQFVRAIHDAAMVPVHELSFTSLDRKPKPPGAVRVELFVDLISPDEPIPPGPGMAGDGERGGGARWPFYLRSFTRSPIRVTPPLASVPMRVVYWARWADSSGNVGPFSATAVGWTEGGSHHLMGMAGPGLKLPKMIDISSMETVGEADETRHRHSTVIVALMETQRPQIGKGGGMRSLPSPQRSEDYYIEQSEAAADAA